MDNAETGEVAHIPGENDECVLRRNCCNGDVRKARVLTSRSGFVGDLPGQAGRHGIERQEPAPIEEHEFVEPARERIRPFTTSLPAKFADTLLDLSERYGWQEQVVGLASQPTCHILPDWWLSRRKRRDDAGIDQVSRQSSTGRSGVASRSTSIPAGIDSRKSARLGRSGAPSRSPISIGTSMAAGRPCLVITVGSPFSAASTSAESVALASRSWMVFIGSGTTCGHRWAGGLGIASLSAKLSTETGLGQRALASRQARASPVTAAAAPIG
jgi:hypothetical protein